jgi:hypothetical protein
MRARSIQWRHSRSVTGENQTAFKWNQQGRRCAKSGQQIEYSSVTSVYIAQLPWPLTSMRAIVYSYEGHPSGPTNVLLNLLELAVSKDRIFFDNRLFTE